jgi:hypothetical protein
MPETASAATNKIFQRLKGLRAQMQTDEEPILALPAIWDSGSSSHSTACDVIVTNQRLIGYYYRGFPRERIFIETLDLAKLNTVTWRDKNFEPVFREILVSDGLHKVYIRTPRQKSALLYETIQMLTEQNDLASKQQEITSTAGVDEQIQVSTHRAPIYGHEEVRRPFENTVLSNVVLLVGGILLEIFGILLLTTLHNASISIPLFVAGFVAVAASFLSRLAKK